MAVDLVTGFREGVGLLLAQLLQDGGWVLEALRPLPNVGNGSLDLPSHGIYPSDFSRVMLCECKGVSSPLRLTDLNDAGIETSSVWALLNDGLLRGTINGLGILEDDFSPSRFLLDPWLDCTLAANIKGAIW